MTNYQWKPGDIAVDGIVAAIADGDGALAYISSDGRSLPQPGRCKPTGLRAIPIDVCEWVAGMLRESDAGSHVITSWAEWADILDPPAPQPEPEWVTLDAGNGDTWQPTQADVGALLSYLTAEHSHPNVLRDKARQLAEFYAQLADGRELRP